MTRTANRWIWWSIATLAVFALAVPKLLELRAKASASSPPPGAFSALVSIEPLRPSSFVETYETTGTLRADEEVELRSEIAGRVTTVAFHEGSPVAAGALLVQMFDADLQARRARIATELRLAERELERQGDLLAAGGATQQVYDRAASTRDVLRAQLQEVDADLIRTEIRAPFSGVVGLREVSPGAYVSSGTTVATLRVLHPLKLEFSVPERLAAFILVGTPVRFSVQGHAADMGGVVYASEPGVDEATRTVRYRARVQNRDGLLRPGAFARVAVTLQEQTDALLVPTVAVVASGAQQSLYVYRGGTAEMRVVQTGARTRDRVQILSGVAPGDSIVVSGLQTLRPGLGLVVDTSASAFRPEIIRPIEGSASPSSRTP